MVVVVVLGEAVVGGRVVVVDVLVDVAGGSAVVVVVEAGCVTARLKIPCAPPLHPAATSGPPAQAPLGR